MLCRERLGGIYCRACRADLSGDHYYHAAKRECLECVRSMPRGAWLLVALVNLIALGLLIERFARGRLLAALEKVLAWKRRLSSSSIVASLIVTAKTLIDFLQRDDTGCCFRQQVLHLALDTDAKGEIDRPGCQRH